jgi:hypothetical protein
MIWLILAALSTATLACIGLAFVLTAQRVVWEFWSRLPAFRTRIAASVLSKAWS